MADKYDPSESPPPPPLPSLSCSLELQRSACLTGTAAVSPFRSHGLIDGLSACVCVLFCLPVRLVGKGSFGSVYLVSRRRDKAQFVLKNMQIKNVPDKELEVSTNTSMSCKHGGRCASRSM